MLEELAAFDQEFSTYTRSTSGLLVTETNVWELRSKFPQLLRSAKP